MGCRPSPDRMKDIAMKLRAVILAFVVSPALADDFEAASPLFNNSKEEFPPIISSLDEPIWSAHCVRKSGTYCDLAIQGNGSRGLTLAKPGLFRAILIDVNTIK